MMPPTRLFPVLMLAIAALAACQTSVVYTETRTPDASGWHYADTLYFTPTLPAADTCGMYLWVRHSKQYAYSNLWLRVISGHDFLADSTGRVEVRLADKSGRWLGQCSQSWCTVRVALREHYGPEGGATFQVAVLPLMREDIVKGIRDVGLEVICP